MNALGRPAIASVLRMVDQIPEELLAMKSSDYGLFMYAKEQIREILDVWTANAHANQKLQNFTFDSFKDPIRRLKAVLSTCPDAGPVPATTGLSLVTDAGLRKSLLEDIGAINRALSNGEWKASTILAGSAIEALLLWKLTQNAVMVTASVARLVASKTFKTAPAKSLEDWNLFQYAEVSADLGFLKPTTLEQVQLARQFRNFIHPGVSLRTAQVCDRGTALSAVAGLEHVIRDLT